MTAKEYLNMPYELHMKIKSDTRRLESFRELATSISSPQFGDKVQTDFRQEAPFVRYICMADELEHEIYADKRRLEELKDEVDRAIDTMESEKEQIVLRYRYVLLMTMPQIAEKMKYTKRRVQQIHSAALEHFKIP